MKEGLVIINNEKCVIKNSGIYCQNLELKSLPEGLNSHFDINLILRKSNVSAIHKIDVNNIDLSNNVLGFIINLVKEFKNKKTKYLIISITPYTFIAYLFLIFSRKKIFLYLRSDGLDEWKLIFNSYFALIYRFMLFLMIKKSTVISVNKKILVDKNYKLVLPSQLTQEWFKEISKPNFDEIKLLYVGRINVVKGIFSLLHLYKKMNLDKEHSLSIVGPGKKIIEINKNIKVLETVSKPKDLIKIYDYHNITILPSFTEGHPQVLFESLARMRPIIIFKEIDFIKKDYYGVFVADRETNSLEEKIKYICNNYDEITASMKKNILPTKENFLDKMIKILAS